MNINKFSISLGVVLLVTTAFTSAQQGPRSGNGPGPNMNMQFDESNVSGWSLMNAEERSRYHERMMSSKNYDDCLMIQKEQHTQMQSRAKDQGRNLASPRQSACERMRERGFFN